MINKNNSAKKDAEFNKLPATSGKYLYGFLIVLFAAALFLRSPLLFMSPRFWAEEGQFYYAQLQNDSIFSVVTLVVNGNYQFLINSIVFVATLVPAQYAAFVTTYLAFAITLILVIFVGIFAVQNSWPRVISATVVLILALLPQGYEIYLSATNLQWVCSATMLMVAVTQFDHGRVTSRGSISIFVLSIACGLTGVTSIMLAPFFLIRKWISPSPKHFAIGVILSICALIQLVVIFTHHHPDRALPTSGLILTAPILLQTILSPLIGVELVDIIAVKLQTSSHQLMLIFAFQAVILLIFYIVGNFAKKINS